MEEKRLLLKHTEAAENGKVFQKLPKAPLRWQGFCLHKARS
jgi:hypothetical protein